MQSLLAPCGLLLLLCLQAGAAGPPVVSHHRKRGSAAAPRGPASRKILDTPETLKAGTTQLLHFLEAQEDDDDDDDDDKPGRRMKKIKMPYSQFLPACLDHVQELVAKCDRGYSDLWLLNALQTQCELEDRFPRTYEDGFTREKACMEFAHRLVDARYENLETGSTAGYEEFCTKYYLHRGGKLSAEEMEEERKKEEAKKKKKSKKTEAESDDSGIGVSTRGWKAYVFTLIGVGIPACLATALYFHKRRNKTW